MYIKTPYVQCITRPCRHVPVVRPLIHVVPSNSNQKPSSHTKQNSKMQAQNLHKYYTNAAATCNCHMLKDIQQIQPVSQPTNLL